MQFDLTSEAGRKQALESFDRYGWLYATGPWLVKKAFDWFSTTNKNTIQEQRETAIELIKAGKNNGVDTMTITLDQKAGIDIGAKVEGIPIKAQIGSGGKMTLEVKYKNA